MDYSISPEAEALLAALGHPARLRILQALERQGVRSVPELAHALELKYDPAYFAVERLAAVGAVEHVRTEPSGTGSPIRYFQVRRWGWTALAQQVERLATEDPPRSV
jgi:predicted ArsR family transcriptional regulator